MIDTDEDKTRRVAEAIRTAVGDDVHSLTQSLRSIAIEVNAATTKLAQHEHSMQTAVRVAQWIGAPLAALFCWIMLRGQASIDDALRSQHQMQLKIESILVAMERDRKISEQQHNALSTRVERIEAQRMQR
ncbi:MAG: hypothetical protein ACK5YB_05440 [Burkholderiales bacterium]|jgi:hypothetical protein